MDMEGSGGHAHTPDGAQVEYDYDPLDGQHGGNFVRMGTYTTNEDGLLHGHQVELRSEWPADGETTFTAKIFELRDGTFKDNYLHHGVEFDFDFTVRTARTITEQNLWSDSDIAQLSAHGSLDDEIHRGLDQIDVGVWNWGRGNSGNDCYYACSPLNLFQSLHDNGPFQYSLYRKTRAGTNKFTYTFGDRTKEYDYDVYDSERGPDIQESVWRLQ